jgi:hypothetical protein
MAEKKKYNSILVSGRKDETLTFSRYVKDEDSGESVKESLDKKVNTTDKLESQQIKDGAITNEKLAADSVGNSNLQDGSVSNEKLEDGSVTNEKLAENSITKDKLKDNTIGVEKLDPELRQTINAATGLPENLVETIQNVDDTLKDHQSQLDDKQSQIDDKQQQITANDDDISLLQTRSTQMEETIKSIAATGGASQATAVTYDNANSQLTATNIQSAVDELQGSKIDKTSILQESGEYEDKVMSQKAVSTKLSYLSVNVSVIKNANAINGEKELVNAEDVEGIEGVILKNDGTTTDEYTNYSTSDFIRNELPKPLYVQLFATNLDTGWANVAYFNKEGNFVESFLFEGTKIVCVPPNFSIKVCALTKSWNVKKARVINDINIKKITDNLQESKFDKSNIAQESGEAEDKVMSQKAVTEIINEKEKPLGGIKISWYGTSIPNQGYPQIVGEYLGANVTNETYGSSAARRGAKTTSYDNDPYKIKGLPWSVPVYGLMMSVKEKNEVLSNWKEYADTWSGTYEGELGAPTNAKPKDINDGAHDQLIATLRDLCYDVRVARHCGINSEYNTKDVDVSDIYVIEHAYNDVQPLYKDTESDFSELPSDNFDVNNPIGSLNALIKYIYTNNPQANIMLIGHYECETSSGKHCKSVIETVSSFWSIPLLKLYDICGLSQRKIKTNGYFDNNNIWHDKGFSFIVGDNDTFTTNANPLMFNYGKMNKASEAIKQYSIVEGDGNATWELTRKHIMLPDDLHPSSKSTKEYFAKLIASWITSIYKKY